PPIKGSGRGRNVENTAGNSQIYRSRSAEFFNRGRRRTPQYRAAGPDSQGAKERPRGKNSGKFYPEKGRAWDVCGGARSFRRADVLHRQRLHRKGQTNKSSCRKMYTPPELQQIASR